MKYFLLIVILIIVFRRPILRYFAKYMAKKFEKSAQQGGFGFKEQRRPSQNHVDGETFVSSNKKNNATDTLSNSDEGDYVDFEEV